MKSPYSHSRHCHPCKFQLGISFLLLVMTIGFALCYMVLGIHLCLSGFAKPAVLHLILSLAAVLTAGWLYRGIRKEEHILKFKEAAAIFLPAVILSGLLPIGFGWVCESCFIRTPEMDLLLLAIFLTMCVINMVKLMEFKHYWW